MMGRGADAGKGGGARGLGGIAWRSYSGVFYRAGPNLKRTKLRPPGPVHTPLPLRIGRVELRARVARRSPLGERLEQWKLGFDVEKPLAQSATPAVSTCTEYNTMFQPTPRAFSDAVIASGGVPVGLGRPSALSQSLIPPRSRALFDDEREAPLKVLAWPPDAATPGCAPSQAWWGRSRLGQLAAAASPW